MHPIHICTMQTLKGYFHCFILYCFYFCHLFSQLWYFFIGKDSGGQWLEEECGGHVWNGRKEENVWCSAIINWSKSAPASMQININICSKRALFTVVSSCEIGCRCRTYKNKELLIFSQETRGGWRRKLETMLIQNAISNIKNHLSNFV